jgi:dynein heavy chain
MAQDLKSLRDYEDRTLEMLTASEQHLLDRHDLIENLTRSKITSDEIANRYHENELNERQINLARQCYVSLAKRGSVLYFLINHLSRLNIMYQFSLTWFQRTFHSCILDRDTTRRMSMTTLTPDVDPLQRYAKQRRRSSLLNTSLQSPRHSISEESTHEQMQSSPLKMRRNTKPFASTINPQQRAATLRIMVDRLTFTIYQLVSWSLFAEHQLLFSFLLTTTIEREAHNNEENNQKIINTPDIIQEEEEEEENEEKKDEHEQETKLSFITQDEWTCFMSPLLTTINEDKLSFVNEQLPSLYSICEELLLDINEEFFQTPNPYLYLTRHDKYSELSRFRCVLLIKILRPDLLLSSISQYVTEQMGSKFLSFGFADIQDVYTHSSPQAPIILLLSPGTDPTSLLLRFAKETRGSASHLDVISLGQGQGPKVEEVLSKALTLKGRWIFLHNCHLSASFMPRLRVLVNK